jgi:hypothetical protein
MVYNFSGAWMCLHYCKKCRISNATRSALTLSNTQVLSVMPLIEFCVWYFSRRNRITLKFILYCSVEIVNKKSHLVATHCIHSGRWLHNFIAWKIGARVNHVINDRDHQRFLRRHPCCLLITAKVPVRLRLSSDEMRTKVDSNMHRWIAAVWSTE